MKTVTLSLMLALMSSNLAFAQSGVAKKVDPAMTAHSCDMKTMDMKGMDMKSMDMKGMDMKGMDAQKCKDMMNGKDHMAKAKDAMTMTHKTNAVVKDVDAANGKVTLAHKAVKSLNWPAMTMAFSVKEKSLFNKLVVGKKVNVEFKKEGADYVVTAVK